MIKISVNNKQTVEITQEEDNKEITVNIVDHKGTINNNYTIEAPELITLLNDYVYENNL